MALQAFVPRYSLANAWRCELDSSSTARLASLPASFPACGGPVNERASHFQQRASSLGIQQRPAIEGDWNTRMLFGEGAVSSAGRRVAEVDKDSFWPTLEAAGDKLVVLDMYTRWCGPCRLIYPKLVKLLDKYTDVIFVKLHCVPENKPLTSKLGVGILPTFKIFKNKGLVSEVKGAKLDELVQKIEQARSDG